LAKIFVDCPLTNVLQDMHIRYEG